MSKLTFKKNKYTILKKVLSPDVADFFYKYFLLKRQVAATFYESKYLPENREEWGTWGDTQVPNTYSHYADLVMETLLVKFLPTMQKTTGLKLNPNYSYARIYKRGDVLHRHKDRFSCEISTTLNLGGDPWPIYLEPNKNVGIPNGKKITITSKNKGIKVNLKPGDMLIYEGNKLEHWREEFKGAECTQVFLHYNNAATPNADKNIFDGRVHLGLPSVFRKND
tara:strand:+ start:481 stop:1149 length:669 start_codon:yes stop_codon:yes gene_type:complete